MITVTIDDVLARLPNAKRVGSGWRCACPAHGGDNKSALSIARGAMQAVVTKCYTHGCSYEDVLRALGLWREGEHAEWREWTFDYVDENGELLYQVVRSEPRDRTASKEKFFKQRRPDGKGGWVWHLNCSNEEKCRKEMSRPELNHEPLRPSQPRRVPYALQELMRASKDPDAVVFVVEGEKKADHLLALGVAATTTVGGGGSWREEYASWFDGLNVVVLPDNNDVGRKYASDVANSLIGKAKEVVIVDLPGLAENEDVDDWLAKPGNDLERFNSVVVAEYERKQAQDLAFYNPRDVTRSAREWARDDRLKPLRGRLRGDVFVPGEVSMIFGPSGSGKSYEAFDWSRCFALGQKIFDMETEQSRVLYLSEEMPPQVVKHRCNLMWDEETLAAMGDRFMIRCQSEFDFAIEPDRSLARLVEIIREYRAEIVIIDAMNDVHSGDENSNKDMAVVTRKIRSAARLTGAVIILIHHAGKKNEFRDGIQRARGASVITDKLEAVVIVDPIPGADGELRSSTKFEKARHATLTKPSEFDFVQEEDPGRMVNAADPKNPDRMRPAIVMVTAPHVEHRTSTRDVARVVQAVNTFLDAREGEDVLQSQVVDVVPATMSPPMGRNKFKQALKDAKTLGMLRSEGKPAKLTKGAQVV